jgi:hypothetical protein
MQALLAGPAVAQQSVDRKGTDTSDQVQQDKGYATFFARLQNAVRADDRATVATLVSLPLRVSHHGRDEFHPVTRWYANRAAVLRDYPLIFTSRVRGAILEQSMDNLFTRDQGAMIGGGEVWFDYVYVKRGLHEQKRFVPAGVLIISINN